MKTRVIKQNINPEWNDDLTLSVVDPNLPVLIVSIIVFFSSEELNVLSCLIFNVSSRHQLGFFASALRFKLKVTIFLSCYLSLA